MSVKHSVRRLFWKAGYDVSRFHPTTHPVARKRSLLAAYSIDLVLDVGANAGQFARKLREDIGFSGRIVSFEPRSTAFALLQKNASSDARWDVRQCALGDTVGEVEINIAGNSSSSSLLRMLDSHSNAFPESRTVGRERVQIRTLDSLMDSICSTESNIYLKIDTQGFESKVLKGAEDSLRRIGTIQLEMSLVPLYDGEATLIEMHEMLGEQGYQPVSIEPVFSDRTTGQLLQVDGIYHRF